MGNSKSRNAQTVPQGSESFPVSSLGSRPLPRLGLGAPSAMCLAYSTTRNLLHTPDSQSSLSVSSLPACSLCRVTGCGSYGKYGKMSTITRSRKEPKSTFFSLSFFPGEKVPLSTLKTRGTKKATNNIELNFKRKLLS